MKKLHNKGYSKKNYDVIIFSCKKYFKKIQQ
jgi:hypothetical protein